MLLFTLLKEISNKILQSTLVEEELTAADELSQFFNLYFALSLKDSDYNTEIITQGGIAISLKEAALCVDDKLRTVRFIKGIYAAMKELTLRFPSEKINILYAGCGPFATLIIPLLPYLTPDKVTITLLEINPKSIDLIKQWLTLPELKHYDINVINCDASTYNKPDHTSLHLIISETMFNGLVREPQLAITANLAPQLHPNGILIPESIDLSLAYSCFSKEPFLKHEYPVYEGIEDGKIGNHHHGIIIDQLFKLDKINNFSNRIRSTPACIYTSKWYVTPISISEYPDVCVFTDITVFKEQRLGLAASYITNPICVYSFYNLLPQQEFRLVYSISAEPKWVIEKKE